MPRSNTALAFGAVLGGALVIDYGIKNTRKAFAGAGAGVGSATSTSSSNMATGNDAQDIKAAAARWGVPTWVLWGVYGIETQHGKDVRTSSAGAVGKMQFEPPTAASYNYPLTNTPNAQQSAAQFDAAAHYLHDLLHQTGSWAAALMHYSGGGYGLTQVQAASVGAP